MHSYSQIKPVVSLEHKIIIQNIKELQAKYQLMEQKNENECRNAWWQEAIKNLNENECKNTWLEAIKNSYEN